MLSHKQLTVYYFLSLAECQAFALPVLMSPLHTCIVVPVFLSIYRYYYDIDDTVHMFFCVKCLALYMSTFAAFIRSQYLLPL